MEEYRLIEFTVSEDAGKRLDVFLASVLEGYSRSGVQKLIRSGNVTVNGSVQKAGYILKGGDSILCKIVENKPSLVPFSMKLDIIYEDDHIIAVNKPPGIVVHPGAGNKEKTLVHVLLAHCGFLASVGSPERPGIVHRLDKGTSGVIVVAKTNSAYFKLVEQFKNRKVSKEYLALVWGNGLDGKEEGTVKGFLGRHSKDRKRITFRKEGKESITYWRIVKRWRDFSLIEAKPITGRTHQIRVHLSYVNCPILGDTVYGGHEKRCKAIKNPELREKLQSIDHQLLHAYRISFLHPITERPITLEATPPEDMLEIMDFFDSYFGVSEKGFLNDPKGRNCGKDQGKRSFKL